VTDTQPEAAFRLGPQQFDPAIPVESISEHPRNPNEGDIGAIHESMGQHGFVGAIMVQRSTGYVLDGNHTYRTAVAKGALTLPGFWLDVDDDEALRILMDINHTARLGRDDLALASALLLDLRGRGDLPASYSDDDLQQMLDDLSGPAAPDEFPEYGDDISTEHECPRCGYAFSGGTKRPVGAEDAGAGP
jgi:hypothetical protein